MTAAVAGPVLLATTAGGKEIQLVRVPNKSVRFIAFKSGGKLPTALQGAFTSVASAKAVAESYVAKQAFDRKSKK